MRSACAHAARAGSLGAPEEGRRYYSQAASLADDRLREAELLEQAGRLAIRANERVEAREQLERATQLTAIGAGTTITTTRITGITFERALALYADAGDMRAAGRASAALADVDFEEGRLEEAATRLEQAVAQLEKGRTSDELAAGLAQLGRMRVLGGHHEDAAAPLDRALTLAERIGTQPTRAAASRSSARMPGLARGVFIGWSRPSLRGRRRRIVRGRRRAPATR